jgi:hypothetical protein
LLTGSGKRVTKAAEKLALKEINPQQRARSETEPLENSRINTGQVIKG